MFEICLRISYKNLNKLSTCTTLFSEWWQIDSVVRLRCDLLPCSLSCQNASHSCYFLDQGQTWRSFPWCNRGNTPSEVLYSEFVCLCVFICVSFSHIGSGSQRVRGFWPHNLWPHALPALFVTEILWEQTTKFPNPPSPFSSQKYAGQDFLSCSSISLNL